MKSHTDLPQSKKLAKILPLESADMYWLNRHIDLTENKYELFVVDKSNKHIDFFNSYAVAVNKGEIIPCWSLAALIDVMPSVTLDSSDDHHYRLFCKERFSEWHDNPIDACVAMIEKLNELKML